MLDRMTYLCEAVKCFQTPLDFNGRISQSTKNKKSDGVVLPQLTQWVLSRIRAGTHDSQFFTVHVTQRGSPNRQTARTSFWHIWANLTSSAGTAVVVPWMMAHALDLKSNWYPSLKIGSLELSLTEWLTAQYHTVSPKAVGVSHGEESRRLSRLRGCWGSLSFLG